MSLTPRTLQEQLENSELKKCFISSKMVVEGTNVRITVDDHNKQ